MFVFLLLLLVLLLVLLLLLLLLLLPLLLLLLQVALGCALGSAMFSDAAETNSLAAFSTAVTTDILRFKNSVEVTDENIKEVMLLCNGHMTKQATSMDDARVKRSITIKFLQGDVVFQVCVATFVALLFS